MSNRRLRRQRQREERPGMTEITRTYRTKRCDCGAEFAPGGPRSRYCPDCKAGVNPDATAGGQESARESALAKPELIDAEVIAFFDRKCERAEAEAAADRELLAACQQRCDRRQRDVEATRNARDYLALHVGRPLAEVLAEARAEQAQVQINIEEVKARIARLEEWERDLIGYERVLERLAADEAGGAQAPCAIREEPPAPSRPLTMREVVMAASNFTADELESLERCEQPPGTSAG